MLVPHYSDDPLLSGVNSNGLRRNINVVKVGNTGTNYSVGDSAQLEWSNVLFSYLFILLEEGIRVGKHSYPCLQI
jgi:hypothetical protein